MSQPSKVNENLEKLADIKARNPSATHVYMRRCDKDNLVVDIPIDHAEFTIRNRPAWELVSSNRQMDDEVEALFREPEPGEEGTLAAAPFEETNNVPPPVVGKPVENLNNLPVSDPKPDELVIPPKPSEVKLKTKRNVRKKTPTE